MLQAFSKFNYTDHKLSQLALMTQTVSSLPINLFESGYASLLAVGKQQKTRTDIAFMFLSAYTSIIIMARLPVVGPWQLLSFLFPYTISRIPQTGHRFYVRPIYTYRRRISVDKHPCPGREYNSCSQCLRERR